MLAKHRQLRERSAPITGQRPPPKPLLKDLNAAIGPAALCGPDEITDLPAEGGAYALILDVTETLALSRPRAACDPLAAGWYIYAGSARGPGGIRARLARHMRQDKAVHWHIDQVTIRNGTRVWAAPFPDRTECHLVSDLTASGRFVATHPGFGSSDCKLCPAHLLMWQLAG